MLCHMWPPPHAVSHVALDLAHLRVPGARRTLAPGRAEIAVGAAARHGKDLLHGLLGVSLHLGKRRGVSVIADQLREHLVSGADCTHASSPTGVRPWGAYSPNLEQLRA
eukprot:Tamp_14060.p3 GENE.Tamp_14060~~Tamp_14060.p3  ORF type:complete len:109 (-),score=0.47 Tamp_14060:159-485(-)